MMRLSAAFFLVVSLLACGSLAAQMRGLRVVGNQIQNSEGAVVTFRGVNRPGTEYSCLALGETFSTPADQASIDVMKAWNINTVRIPLNEDCWLGTAGNLSINSSGAAYQEAIANFTTLLTDNGMAVILTLLWTSWNPGFVAAEGLSAMPNAAQSPAFWESVATRFRQNSGVVFDLFSEPFPNGAVFDTEDAWNCWRNGVSCTLLNYEPAGMQSLVNAVRNTGATNLILVSGIQHGNSLARWNQYKPTDNNGNLAASMHLYDYSFCNQRGCWDLYVAPLAKTVPVVGTEIGEYDCTPQFINDWMNYADGNNMHYVAWTWLAGDCKYGSALLEDDTGKASKYGAGFQSHLANIAAGQPAPYWLSYDLFDDKLNWRMSDWSTQGAQLFLNSTNTYSGKNSIMFEPTTDNYALFQCWACIDSTVHRGIEFYVNGGEGGQQIYIHLVKMNLSTIAESAANPNVSIITTDAYTYNVSAMLKGLQLPKNKWMRAYVNLSMFENDEKFDGIRIETANGLNQSAFYLDNIRVWDIYESPAYAVTSSLFFIAFALAALLF